MSARPEKLILASASPRRRELLERIGLRFEIRPADVEEEVYSVEGPAGMVAANAALKASGLSAAHPEALVLGSDTTVALGDEVLNKPHDLDEARVMLLRLSGRSHTVYTAVALYWEAGGLKEAFTESSEVRFKAFREEVVDRYFKQVDPLDKAGAYGIQQAREMIIESVDGSVENVMGMPVQALERKLAELQFDFKV
ncbi:MAG TPA: Maf family protein [Opitutales bacterium]|nr:Maf family protein [Opitutales bacterium]